MIKGMIGKKSLMMHWYCKMTYNKSHFFQSDLYNKIRREWEWK